jgi:uncharacterized membrane protein (UPF0182 family)
MSHQYLPRRQHRIWGSLIVAVVGFLVILGVISSGIVKWLWMRNLNYAAIFWTLLSTQWILALIAFLIAFLFLWINLRIIASKAGFDRTALNIGGDIQLSFQGFRSLAFFIAAIVALGFGLVMYSQWDTYIRFHYGGAFGLSDPLFGVDVGFCVFRLPFYELLQNSLSVLAQIAFFIGLIGYSFLGLIQAPRGWKMRQNHVALPHVFALLAVTVGSWAWGFYLDRFDLLYSSFGVVYGPGYTAWNITRIDLWVMIAASILLCGMLVVCVFRPNLRIIAGAGGAYTVLYIAGILLLPFLVQKAQRAGVGDFLSEAQHRFHTQGF